MILKVLSVQQQTKKDTLWRKDSSNLSITADKI
jgi:hypothetical protein